MKYTEQEQLDKILHRGEKLRKKKNRNVLRGLSVAVAVLFVLLAVSIGALGGTGTSESGTVYGSFMLSADTGGYILVAILAFAAGIITTILIIRYKKQSRNRSNKET